MDFDRLVENNGVYLYQDNNINTITIRLNFMGGLSNRDCAIDDLLCYYLAMTNKNFKNDNEITQRSKELYSLNLFFSNEYCSKQKYITVDINLISPESIDVDYYKDAFEFIRQIIKEPDFTNEEMFKIIKRKYLAQRRADLSDIDEYVDSMYNQTVTPEKNRKYDYATDMRYITRVVNSITLDELKKEYEYMINNYHSGFVYGKISEDRFNEFVDSMSLLRTKQEVTYERDVPTIEGETEIDVDGEQSYIYVTYDMDQVSFAQLRLLRKLLNSSVGLCYQILREKGGLVYSSSASILYYLKKMYFYGEIDKDKKEQFIKGVEEIVRLLQDKDVLNNFLERAKVEMLIDEVYISEDADKIVNEVLDSYVLKLYEGLNRTEVNHQILDETADSLYNVTKSLKRKNVFMARGMDNE